MMKFILVILFLVSLHPIPSIAFKISGKINLKNPKGELDTTSEITTTLIYIVPFKSKQKFSIPKNDFKMDQKDKAFIPLVMPVLVGTTVEFNNLDPYMHNVFSTSNTKTFDLGLYKLGDKGKKVKFDKTGIVNIYCNIHEQMLGFIVVLENPYFTMANQKGEFTLNLENVPSGKYKIVTWHRFAGQKVQEIEVSNNDLTNIHFEITKNESIDMDKLKLLTH